MTSADQLTPIQAPPYFILIDRALRDEGTSYHYLAPTAYSAVGDALLSMMKGAFDDIRVPVHQGATWTTDAPFRETAESIAAMRDKGLLAVEMEAAALYAFAEGRGKPVLAFAHVTNQMGRIEGDFEKGEANGTRRNGRDPGGGESLAPESRIGLQLNEPNSGGCLGRRYLTRDGLRCNGGRWSPRQLLVRCLSVCDVCRSSWISCASSSTC